jgi:quinol monooxygenase YgiN
MFARFLEMTIKPDKKAEFTKKVKDEIVPILRTYKGFFDVIHLEVETEPTKFYSISFWHDKAEMEKYTKENFPKVKAILEPFLTAPLIVKPCVFDETITKKFTAVAA